MGHHEHAPSPHDAAPHQPAVPLSVVGAVTMDAVAIGGAAALVLAAASNRLDRAVAAGVVIAGLTAVLMGNVALAPSARPGTSGRLLGRELIVVSLSLLSLPLALGLSLHETLDGGTIALASVVAVALAFRMAMLTRRADQYGRVQAGRVAQLTRLALHDPLTGLPNRTLLEDRLAMALAGQRRSGSVLAVLFCDLDHFKVVNDTIGHDAGDEVLVVTAHRLTNAVRATDTVSRLGGDEFVVLCPDLSSELELTEVIERILGLLVQPMLIEGQELVVSGSVGVAVVRAEAARSTSLTDLLREADAAMYRAKAHGRNRWERLPLEPPPEVRPRYVGVRPEPRDPALTDR